MPYWLHNLMPYIILDLALFAAFVIVLVLLVGSRNDRRR